MKVFAPSERLVTLTSAVQLPSLIVPSYNVIETKSLLVPFWIATVFIPVVASVTVTLKATVPVIFAPEGGSMNVAVGLTVSTLNVRFVLLNAALPTLSLHNTFHR